MVQNFFYQQYVCPLGSLFVVFEESSLGHPKLNLPRGHPKQRNFFLLQCEQKNVQTILLEMSHFYPFSTESFGRRGSTICWLPGQFFKSNSTQFQWAPNVKTTPIEVSGSQLHSHQVKLIFQPPVVSLDVAGFRLRSFWWPFKPGSKRPSHQHYKI